MIIFGELIELIIPPITRHLSEQLQHVVREHILTRQQSRIIEHVVELVLKGDFSAAERTFNELPEQAKHVMYRLLLGYYGFNYGVAY